MTKLISVFPPGMAAHAAYPKTPGAEAVAYGPHDERILRQKGWSVADLATTYDAARQYAALEKAWVFSNDTAACARDVGFDETLARHIACDCVRHVCGWERFQHATRGAKSVWFAGPQPRELDTDLAYGEFEPSGRLSPLQPIPPMEKRALRWANRRIMRRLPSKPHFVYFASRNLPVALTDKVRRQTGRLRVRYVVVSDWPKAVAHMFKGLFARRASVTLPLAVPPVAQRRLADLVSRPPLSTAPRFLVDRLCHSIAWYVAAQSEFAELLHHAPTTELIGLFAGVLMFPKPQQAACAAALASSGHKVVVFTHGSVCAHGGGVGEAVTRLFAEHGYVSIDCASHVVPRAPSLISRGSENPYEVLPAIFRDRTQRARTETREPGPFTVLHAGNYVSWHSPHWVVPSEFDYYRSLFELVDAASKVDGVRVVIRIKTTAGPKNAIWKAKLEIVDPDDFFAELGEQSHVERSHEASIVDDILAADLVVCEGWTSVIHDALELGKPVLFHTRTGAFSHLPARLSPPSYADRSAVYASGSGEALTEMLAAIRLAHAGRPLTDEELAGYRWPSTSPTASACLERILLNSNESRRG